jgi:hypothetical protein
MVIRGISLLIKKIILEFKYEIQNWSFLLFLVVWDLGQLKLVMGLLKILVQLSKVPHIVASLLL